MADERRRPRSREPNLPSAKRRRVRGINSRIDKGDLKLRGEDARIFFDDAIIAGTLTRTLAGASSISLTVEDPEFVLLGEKLKKDRFDLELDGLWFRWRGVRKTGTELELTFEDREVSYLRKLKGPKKAFRDKVTRAEFVKSLVREVKGVKIPVYIPELHKVQPIESTKQAVEEQEAQTDRRGKVGLDKTENLTVKGVKANPEQLRNGAIVLQVGASLKAPRPALLAVIMAGIQENSMLNTGDGYFQITDATLSGLPYPRSDLAAAAKDFFNRGWYTGKGAIADAKAGYPPTQIAQRQEGSAYPSAYAQWEDEAAKWVDAFDGGGLSGDVDLEIEAQRKYAFEVAKKQNYWAAIQELATEVRWRAFMSAGIFYYLDEMDMFREKPWAVINEETEGVFDFDFEYMHGTDVTTGTIVGLAKAWAGPPGTTVRASNDDYGIGGGRYIIEEARSDLFSEDVEYKVKKPTKPLDEPAPETVTKSVSAGDAGDVSSGDAQDLQSINLDTSSGTPHWGGSKDIYDAVVAPIVRELGMSTGGTKEGGHNAGSDHALESTLAYAADITGADMEKFARAVAAAFGDESVIHSTNPIYIEVDGNRYRVQVLWDLSSPAGTVGDVYHRSHVHVGIEKQ